jgi:hypothetical protein
MTTNSNLEGVFTAMQDAAVKAGVTEAANWHLEMGSKTYGRAYRVWLSKAETSGHYSPMVNDYLGMTKNEAEATLQAMRSAFLAVAWSQESDDDCRCWGL